MTKKTGLYASIIGHPIMKIIIGGLFCILLPVLINKLLLDNLFRLLNFSENLNQSIRVSITIFLMPLFYVILFSRLEKRKIKELYFTNSKSILLSFLLSFLIIGLSFTLLIILGYIKISLIQLPQNVIVNLILVMSFVIIEEVFFRGILYRIIENSWGTKVAIISSALIFALLHLGNENTSVLSFLSVISGGALLGIIYTYTRNLLAPIAFHFGWNLTQVLLGFGLSGGDEFSSLYVLKLNLEGNEILTGGLSGIENSILAVISLLISFGILYIKSLKENRLLQYSAER